MQLRGKLSGWGLPSDLSWLRVGQGDDLSFRYPVFSLTKTPRDDTMEKIYRTIDSFWSGI